MTSPMICEPWKFTPHSYTIGHMTFRVGLMQARARGMDLRRPVTSSDRSFAGEHPLLKKGCAYADSSQTRCRSSQAQSPRPSASCVVQHLNTTILTTFRYLVTTIRHLANCVCELRELLQVASHGLESQRQLSPTVLAHTPGPF
jgi:hypothetical protein